MVMIKSWIGGVDFRIIGFDATVMPPEPFDHTLGCPVKLELNGDIRADKEGFGFGDEIEPRQGADSNPQVLPMMLYHGAEALAIMADVLLENIFG